MVVFVFDWLRFVLFDGNLSLSSVRRKHKMMET